jgi:hypothetical protein
MPHYTLCAGARLRNQKLAFPEDERAAAGHLPAEFASNELCRPVRSRQKVGGAAFLNAVLFPNLPGSRLLPDMILRSAAGARTSERLPLRRVLFFRPARLG